MRLGVAAAILTAFAVVELAIPAAAEESALQKMKNTGVIKACIAQTNPESFKDAKTGECKGVNVDLLDGLADWVKVKVDWVEVTWATAVLSLTRNDCDMFGGSLQFNAPRALDVSYIVPFWKRAAILSCARTRPGNSPTPKRSTTRALPSPWLPAAPITSWPRPNSRRPI